MCRRTNDSVLRELTRDGLDDDVLLGEVQQSVEGLDKSGDLYNIEKEVIKTDNDFNEITDSVGEDETQKVVENVFNDEQIVPQSIETSQSSIADTTSVDPEIQSIDVPAAETNVEEIESGTSSNLVRSSTFGRLLDGLNVERK